jgi:ribosomal protein L44E
MVISAFATFALYCPRCGKLEFHDVSRFTLKTAESHVLRCSCGQVQATVASACHHQYILSIRCASCSSNHVVCLDSRRFLGSGTDTLSKIYCPVENLELGFAGRRSSIDFFMKEHRQEVERLAREMYKNEYSEHDESIENPKVMLDVLNRVHDIAESGQVHCRCGSSAIEAMIMPECIEIYCRSCGAQMAIPAVNEHDLELVRRMQSIELIPSCYSKRKQ